MTGRGYGVPHFVTWRYHHHPRKIYKVISYHADVNSYKLTPLLTPTYLSGPDIFQFYLARHSECEEIHIDKAASADIIYKKIRK